MTLVEYGVPLVKKLVPPTSKTRYIAGYCALNLDMPDTFADWHQPDHLYCPADQPPEELYVYGEGVGSNYDTNHIFGDYGIIESAEFFKNCGFTPVYPEVYRSNHFRAILDLLHYYIMVNSMDNTLPLQIQGATFEHLGTEVQKQELLNKARLIRPHLPPERRPLLDTWIADEETYEERRARFGRRSAI